MQNKNTLICLSKSFEVKVKPSRLAYLRDANKEDPTATQELRNRHNEGHAIQEKDKSFKRFEGSHLNDTQAVQDIQLGINEKMRGAMERLEGGRRSDLIVLDDRAKRKRRNLVGREMALERQRMGFWRKLGVRLRGRIRNIIGILNENWTDVGIEEGRRYGTNRRVENVNTTLAERVWNGLTPAQQRIVAGWLSIRVFTPSVPGQPDGLTWLATADADILVQMREALSSGANVVFSPARNGEFPNYAGQIEDTHEMANGELFQPIDRLIIEKQTQAESRGDTMSTTNLDYQRLETFLVSLRSNPGFQPVYENLMKILKKNELYRLKERPEQLALVHDIEHRLQVNGPTRLAAILNSIYNELEFKKDDGKGHGEHGADHGGDGEHHEDPIKEIDKAVKEFQETHPKLVDAYRKAATMGQMMYEMSQRIDSIPVTSGAATGGGGRSRSDDSARFKLEEKYREEQVKKADLKNTILEMEAAYKDNAVNLLNRLSHDDLITGTHSILDTLDAQFRQGAHGHITPRTIAESNDLQLFGTTNFVRGTTKVDAGGSAMQGITSRFTGGQVKNLGHDVDNSKLKNKQKEREQIDARSLLYRLQRTDWIKNKITNPDQVNRMASEATDKRVREADHRRFLAGERRVNALISERYGETRLGLRWLKRIEKAVKAQFNWDGYYRMDHILKEEIGREGKFKCLKGLKGDMTLTQVRDLIEKNGGANTAALREFAARLYEVIGGFDLLNNQGRAKTLDREAVDLLEKAKQLELISDEVETETESNEIAKTEKDPGKAFMALQKKKAEKRAKLETELYEPLSKKDANWKQRWSRKVLRENTLEAIYEALDKKAENDWSDWTFEQYLDEQGLRTAYEQAKTKLRVDKVMGVTAGAALGAWALGRNGGNFVIGKGKQYANAVMNRAVRPFGRTVKAVGTEINETMIKPTGEFVGAVAMAPFRLVGWAGGKIKGLFTGGGGHGGGHH